MSCSSPRRSGGLIFGLYFAQTGVGPNLVFGVMGIVNVTHGDCVMLRPSTTCRGIPLFRRRLIIEALATIAFCARERTSQAFTMEYGDTGARMILKNGTAVPMQHVRMASGAHYAGGGYAYDEWHGGVTLTIAGPTRQTTSWHVVR